MQRNFKRILLVIALLISAMATAADQEITVTLQRKAELELSSSSVDLGLPIGTERSQYYERLSAVIVSFRCNANTHWEMRVTGTDFTNGGYTIPITQLSWRKSSSSYNDMPLVGEYAVVADAMDYPGHGANWHDETISYRLGLTGDEYEGTYNATLTYTLFVQ